MSTPNCAAIARLAPATHLRARPPAPTAAACPPGLWGLKRSRWDAAAARPATKRRPWRFALIVRVAHSRRPVRFGVVAARRRSSANDVDEALLRLLGQRRHINVTSAQRRRRRRGIAERPKAALIVLVALGRNAQDRVAAVVRGDPNSLAAGRGEAALPSAASASSSSAVHSSRGSSARRRLARAVRFRPPDKSAPPGRRGSRCTWRRGRRASTRASARRRPALPRATACRAGRGAHQYRANALAMGRTVGAEHVSILASASSAALQPRFPRPRAFFVSRAALRPRRARVRRSARRVEHDDRPARRFHNACAAAACEADALALVVEARTTAPANWSGCLSADRSARGRRSGAGGRECGARARARCWLCDSLCSCGLLARTARLQL